MTEHKDYNYLFDETKCSTCGGKCCIGESGYVWIDHNEMSILADHLEISIEQLKEKYINKISSRYSLKEIEKEKENFVCVFFDTKLEQCTIYNQRPSQCRTFPFWKYFKNNIDELMQECPAILPKENICK